MKGNNISVEILFQRRTDHMDGCKTHPANFAYDRTYNELKSIEDKAFAFFYMKLMII